MHDAETERYYRARAREYEQIYYRDDIERARELAGEAARLRDLAAGRDVVELACGTGYWTRIMAETARSILATDLSEEMIAEARAAGCPGAVDYQVADMFGLPTGDRRFDLVALGFWFSHQPRQHLPELLGLLKSLAKPDGRIWLVDNNPPAEGWTAREHVRKDKYGNNFKRRWLDSGEAFTILKNYFSEAELRDLIGADFKIESLSYGTYYWSITAAPPAR
jgi:SAM-dependent methyltransferase